MKFRILSILSIHTWSKTKFQPPPYAKPKFYCLLARYLEEGGSTISHQSLSHKIIQKSPPPPSKHPNRVKTP